MPLRISSGTLEGVLNFVYDGAAALAKEKVPEALQFAHMYGLKDLLNALEAAVLGPPGALDASLTATILGPECTGLELQGLEQACEAGHGPACTQSWAQRKVDFEAPREGPEFATAL